MTKDQIKQIAREYGRNKKGAKYFSGSFGVTKQTIEQMASKLRFLGIHIPRCRNMGSNFEDAIEELQKESPELFID